MSDIGNNTIVSVIGESFTNKPLLVGIDNPNNNPPIIDPILAKNFFIRYKDFPMLVIYKDNKIDDILYHNFILYF